MKTVIAILLIVLVLVLLLVFVPSFPMTLQQWWLSIQIRSTLVWRYLQDMIESLKGQ